MAKYRVRFNDKARAGAVAKRNELKRKRQKQFHRDEDADVEEAFSVVDTAPNPNAEVLTPLTAEEKEMRKRELAKELQPQKKLNSVKRKRLEKYIDRQVRKQEQDEILAKLAKSKVNTANYQTLARLGMKAGLDKNGTVGEESGDDEVDDEEDESDEDRDDDENAFDARFGATTTNMAPTDEVTTSASTFIDNRRPAGGFAFQNLPKIIKNDARKSKVTWRERLGIEDEEEEVTSDSDEDEDDSSEDDESVDSEPVGPEEHSGDEEEGSAESDFAGFSDDELAESGRDNTKDEDEDSNEDDPNSPEDDEDSDDVGESGADDEDANAATAAPSGKDFVEWVKSQGEQFEPIPTPKVENYEHVPRVPEADPLPREFAPGTAPRERTYFVNVTRPSEISEGRLLLPATASEQQIVEAVHNNDVVVLTGETGSGKTTQVPQFLYEAGYGSPESATPGMIGITQPRRVAAVSMAQRVGKELGDHGSHVGYQIRFDAQVTEGTRLKFMTDGVLLREMATDLNLTKYSVLIVDEAHERSVNTDILIGILSRVVKVRREDGSPLKLIIMSATLRVTDFTQNQALFPVQPPLVSVEARQYPVAVHFNRRTPYDYVAEAVSKAIKIHERLPKGGIIIFLTGQNEINQAVKQLREYSAKGAIQKPEYPSENSTNVRVRALAKDVAFEEETADIEFEEELDVDDNDDGAAGANEDKEEEGFEEEYDGEQKKLRILPLYTLLPTHEQMRVFEPPAEGERLCIVATNVAETSLTIPGIRYVVDCGRVKQRVYEHETGVQKFKISWVSKAAADQRAGRAGRTGPGHCYRLYSSAVYERDFAQFSEPEILRMPVESLVLQMKSMGIHHIVNFPFPSPPARENLHSALQVLRYIGAIGGTDDSVTELGKQMSLFPLHPRHAKMLLIGNQHGCLPYVVALVSAFSVGDPFIQPWELGLQETRKVEAAQSSNGDDSDSDVERPEKPVVDIEEKERLDRLRQSFYRSRATFSSLDGKSDAFQLLSAVAAYEFAPNKAAFCDEHFLRLKIMTEINKLRGQIAHIVATVTRPDAIETVTQSLSGKLAVPTPVQVAALKQIVAAGHIDLVAVRANVVEDMQLSKRTPIARMPYKTLQPSSVAHVFIRPDSVLTRLGAEPPEFLVYQALTVGDAENAKVRMRNLVDVSAVALSNIAAGSPLLTYSKPLSGAYAPKQLTATKREAWVVPRMGAAIGSGGVGWDLPARKVVQIRVNGDWKVQM